jgi:MYXO-CTERM domain-containing protein
LHAIQECISSSFVEKKRQVPNIMFLYAGHRSGSQGRNRFPSFICLAFLLLLFSAGIASATSLENTTTTATPTADTTPEHDRAGGSIYFETYPPGATIWLDNIEIGTSAFTYYTEKTGTFDVRTWRKGYENYTGTVTVAEGKRVVFSAVLTPVVPGIETTSAAPVTTITTVRKSTLIIPTPWPTSTESPADPAVVLGAAALGAALFVIRRR